MAEAPAPTPKAESTKLFSGKTAVQWAITILLIGLMIVLVIHVVGWFHNHQAKAAAAPATILQLPTPTYCSDFWQQDAAGANDHLRQSISYFDVQATTPACFGAWVKVPSDWNTWIMTFMDKPVDGGECHIWFWYFGSRRPIGPYILATIPDFPSGPPTKWMVASTCTFRYTRMG